MPSQRRVRFARYGLNDTQIEIFTVARHLGDYYEHVATELDSVAKDFHIKKRLKGEFPNEPHLGRRLHELSANYIITEFPKYIPTAGEIKITPENYAEFIGIVAEGKINSSAAQTVLKEMYRTGGDPSQIIEEKNLMQMEDDTELEKVIHDILVKNQQSVDDFKAGKDRALQFLVGQVMKETKGKANPAKAMEFIKKIIA